MLSTILIGLVPLAGDTQEAPRGLYVEARTAAVYAGACHYGSQYTTQGRTALLGWRIEDGSFGGVSLAGVELAALVDAERNLKETEAARSSVLYVDETIDAPTAAAALAWLRAEHRELLGEIVAIERGTVDVKSQHDAFALRVGERIRLDGAALPDRACCKMPYDVWYEPLVPVGERLVGCPTVFDVREDALKVRFSRPGENDVFFGRFGLKVSSEVAPFADRGSSTGLLTDSRSGGNVG